MKILIVTPHFYPEVFKCNDMAFELSRRGHEVTVLTAIPDYPQGKWFDGYGFFKKRRETINGVKIYRSFSIPRGNGSSIRLALNYLSYTLFSSLTAFFLGLTKKFDTIIVHETSPIMVGIPAVMIKKMRSVPMHFWVLDLWPESLSAAGGIKNKLILSSFDRLTKWIYDNSNTILIGSKGYKDSISQKGNYSDKIRYFPNWVDNNSESNVNELPSLPKGFNVVFTGNIGDAQDFQHIIECAKILKDNHSINFIIVGDGRKKQWVEECIKKYDLTQVKCLGRFPPSAMGHFYKQADLLLLALKDVPIFALTAPAKIQAYMAAGKPIVAMINGEARELIKDADCGWSVPAEDSQALAELLIELSNEKPEVLNEKGQNGKNYSERYFNFTRSIDKLEKLIDAQ